MKPLSVAVLVALLLPVAGAAHVDVRPTLLASGEEVVLRIELPGLRPNQDPSSLAVGGPGVESVSSERSGRIGEESRWLVRIRVTTPPGQLPLVLVAGYPDGRSVTVRQTLTVIPAPPDAESGSSVIAIVITIASLLFAVGAMIVIRRSRAGS